MAEMDLGHFGDERLKKMAPGCCGALAHRQTVCLRKLGDDRAEKVKFRRFLMNERVTVAKMVASQRARVAAWRRCRHVLAIQDTSEINYEAQRERKRRLGTVGNGSDVGLFVHPVLAVDAGTGNCLGLLGRPSVATLQAQGKGLPQAADRGQGVLSLAERLRTAPRPLWAKAAMMTVIDDREGDIYEKWARLLDRCTHLLIAARACRDRAIVGGGTLFVAMAGLATKHRFKLDLPARPGKRRARQARLDVRFGRLRVCRPTSCSDPNAPRELDLFAIEVREINLTCRRDADPVALADNPRRQYHRPSLDGDRLVSPALAY